MSHIFLQRNGTLTASTGVASVTLNFGDGILMQLYVKAATGTTTFDISLTDINSIKVYDETDIVGTLNDTSQLPLYNNVTLAIANASVDEAFTYLIVVKER